MRHEWRVRLDYGLVRPWVRRATIDGEPVITAIGGPDQLVLRGPRLPTAGDGTHNDEFDVSEGDELVFSMTWFPSYAEPTDLGVATRPDRGDHPARTRSGRRAAPPTCRTPDVVRRSLLTLRLMTDDGDRRHRRRPHDLAARGLRRRAQLGLPLLLAPRRRAHPRLPGRRPATPRRPTSGGTGCCAPSPATPPRCRSCTPSTASRRLPEVTLDHLPGYADSRPVRIGNGAVEQTQTRRARRGDARPRQRCAAPRGMPHEDAWPLQRALVAEMATRWQEPDHGLWEIRGEPRRFTHSRVMIWVAFDRAVRAMEDYGLAGPLEEWRALRDQVREEVLEHGVRRRARHVRPALRHHRGRRLAADAAPRRLRRRRRPADARHHPGHRGGPPPRGAGAALPHRDAASTASPATSTRSSPARSGWSRRTPPPAGSTTRTRSSTGWSGCATTSACSRRSTTRSGSGWSATSRRRSATSPWSRRRSDCGKLPAEAPTATSPGLQPPDPRPGGLQTAESCRLRLSAEAATADPAHCALPFVTVTSSRVSGLGHVVAEVVHLTWCVPASGNGPTRAGRPAAQDHRGDLHAVHLDPDLAGRSDALRAGDRHVDPRGALLLLATLGVAVAVAVEACWLNGTSRPTSSGLWSEERNWLGWYRASAL